MTNKAKKIKQLQKRHKHWNARLKTISRDRLKLMKQEDRIVDRLDGIEYSIWLLENKR